MIKQFSRLTTLAEDLQELGIVSKDIGFGFSVNENGEVVDMAVQHKVEQAKLCEQKRAESIKAIFESTPKHFRFEKKDGTHQVIVENDEGDIEAIVLEQTSQERLEKLQAKVLVESVKAESTLTEQKKTDSEEDYESDTGIEEGLARVRLKRMTPAARAKARRSYRAKKSVIKRARKKVRRTSKFKRRSKLLKRLKRGKSAGPRRRFILKMGIEQASNLLEQTKSFGFLMEAKEVQFADLLEGIKEASLSLADALDEADAFMITVDDLDTDQGEEGYDWIDANQDGEYEPEEQEDEEECEDCDDECKWLDVCESKELRRLAEDAEAAFKDLSKGINTPEEMKKIITAMVQYLGGALETYTALAQEIKDYVGKTEEPAMTEGEVKSPKVEAEQVGEGAPKEVEQSVKPEKVEAPVLGKDSKLDGVEQKVVASAEHGKEVGTTSELEKELPITESASKKKEEWMIIDWASNVMFNGKKWPSFDDAEEFLAEFLDEKYEEDRGEYDIIPVGSVKNVRHGNYIDPKDPRSGTKKVVVKESKGYKNLDKFFDAYLKHLEASIEKTPEKYGYPKEKAKSFVEKVKKSVSEIGIQGVNIDSEAFKKTAKEFGIKPTYKAIEEFLVGAMKESKLSQRMKLNESVSKSVVDSYLETALWSSTDDEGEPLDSKYSITDFSKKSIEKAEKELAEFFEMAREEVGTEAWDELEATQVAHDFWLTRNGHGAGFWDGDYEKSVGQKLTKLSEKFPERNVFAGDDEDEHIVYIEEYLGKGEPKPEGEKPEAEKIDDKERVGKKTEKYTTQKVIEEQEEVEDQFEIVDMGWDNISYFPGFGTHGTKFDIAVYDVGGSAEDAAEQLMQRVWETEASDEVKESIVAELKDLIKKAGTKAKETSLVGVQGSFSVAGKELHLNEVEATDYGEYGVSSKIEIEKVGDNLEFKAIAPDHLSAAEDLEAEIKSQGYSLSEEDSEAIFKLANRHQDNQEWYYHIGFRAKEEEPTKPSGKTEEKKELWKMTKAEYEKQHGKPKENTTVTGGFSAHKSAVEIAKNKGLDVPKEVLADYPELMEESVEEEKIVSELVKKFGEEFKEEIEESFKETGTNSFEFTADGDDYEGYDSEKWAEDRAIDYVQEMLEDEPWEMFSKDFLMSHVYVGPTDIRIMASEEADNALEGMSPEDLVKESSVSDEWDDAFDKDNEKEMARLEKIAEEEFIEKKYEEVSEALKKDPVGYFEDIGGEEMVKAMIKKNFLSIDEKKAAEDAVRTDGWVHFLNRYDSEYEELPSGAVYFRQG